MIHGYRFNEEIILTHPIVREYQKHCPEIICKINDILNKEHKGKAKKYTRYNILRALNMEVFADAWKREREHDEKNQRKRVDMVIGCRHRRAKRDLLFAIEMRFNVESMNGIPRNVIMEKYRETITMLGEQESSVHAECVVLINDDVYQQETWVSSRMQKEREDDVLRATGDEPPYRTILLTEDRFYNSFFKQNF